MLPVGSLATHSHPLLGSSNTEEARKSQTEFPGAPSAGRKAWSFWRPLVPPSFSLPHDSFPRPPHPLHTYLPWASLLRPHGQSHKSVPLFSVACPLPLIQSPLRVFSGLTHSVWQLFNKPICFPLTWGRSGGCWRAWGPRGQWNPFPLNTLPAQDR